MITTDIRDPTSKTRIFQYVDTYHKRNGSDSQLASFPGRRRNGLATSASSNCYFRCPKVGSTNQIWERSHMKTVKPNCVMHWTVESPTYQLPGIYFQVLARYRVKVALRHTYVSVFMLPINCPRPRAWPFDETFHPGRGNCEADITWAADTWQ